MSDHALYACPVCGKELERGPLSAHVGSERCVLRLHARRGKHHDGRRGPQLLKLRQDIDELLSEIEVVGG